jgi:hypothetical protein
VSADLLEVPGPIDCPDCGDALGTSRSNARRVAAFCWWDYSLVRSAWIYCPLLGGTRTHDTAARETGSRNRRAHVRMQPVKYYLTTKTIASGSSLYLDV